MKTLATSLLLLLGLLLFNCSSNIPGPRGAQGPQGAQGPPGSSTLSLMYETNFTLNGSNNWSTIFTFPAADKPNIYSEDVVMVYLLWDQVDGVDVWRLMPVHYFYDAGILDINYDFTVNDVRLFAESTFTLDPNVDKYVGMLARIVIVPADYSPNARTIPAYNVDNYEEVKAALGLKDERSAIGKPFMKILEDIKSSKK